MHNEAVNALQSFVLVGISWSDGFIRHSGVYKSRKRLNWARRQILRLLQEQSFGRWVVVTIGYSFSTHLHHCSSNYSHLYRVQGRLTVQLRAPALGKWVTGFTMKVGRQPGKHTSCDKLGDIVSAHRTIHASSEYRAVIEASIWQKLHPTFYGIYCPRLSNKGSLWDTSQDGVVRGYGDGLRRGGGGAA